MIPRHLTIGVAVMVVLALAMSFYVSMMRGHVDRNEAVATSTQPVSPPPTGPSEQVTLYVADDEAGALHAETARIPLPSGRQERAEELLRALLNIYMGKSSSHVLGPGSEVRNVYLVDPGLAVVDLNAAFADGHRSGVLVEQLTIASLLGTLSSNIPGVTHLKVLVDGKERDTLAGHLDLSGLFEDAEVGQMTAELGTMR